jgi:hypothetical protein
MQKTLIRKIFEVWNSLLGFWNDSWHLSTHSSTYFTWPIWRPEFRDRPRSVENLRTLVVWYLDFNDGNGRAGRKSLFYLLYTILVHRSHETFRFKFVRTNPFEICALLGFLRVVSNRRFGKNRKFLLVGSGNPLILENVTDTLSRKVSKKPSFHPVKNTSRVQISQWDGSLKSRINPYFFKKHKSILLRSFAALISSK